MPSTSFDRITRLTSMPYTTFFMVGSTWPENLISPMPSARPLPDAPSQPRKKPSICHKRVEPEAARHHRIALEMAREEPEIGLQLEDCAHQPLAVFTADFADLRNTVEHQHRRQRQLRTFDKEFASPAGKQVLIVEMRTPFLHPPSLRPQSERPPPRVRASLGGAVGNEPRKDLKAHSTYHVNPIPATPVDLTFRVDYVPR